MTALLLPPFMWGLAGGFSHCIGMCGIFIIASTNIRDTSTVGPHSNKVAHLLFHSGRLVALVSLGAIAGALGSLISFHDRVPAVQGYVSIAAGLVLAVFSLGQTGIVPGLKIPEPNVMEMGGGKVRRVYAKALASRAVLRPLLLGFLVGLLPCGLTYYTLWYVLGTFNAATGAVAMALFAIGSSVGLMTLAVGVSAAPMLLRKPAFRDWIGRASGVIMMAMSAILIDRGWATLHSLT